ncbi:hypothetical protein HK104_001494 [Borealophlyctis nickersoniae]|nr:hypothetical protein HK104_001494 [Borealophlyctis nickersoniae]
MPCTYDREAKKRGPKQGHLRELESRLKQMEALTRRLAEKLPEGSALLTPEEPVVAPAPTQSQNLTRSPQTDSSVPYVHNGAGSSPQFTQLSRSGTPMQQYTPPYPPTGHYPPLHATPSFSPPATYVDPYTQYPVSEGVQYNPLSQGISLHDQYTSDIISPPAHSFTNRALNREAFGRSTNPSAITQPSPSISSPGSGLEEDDVWSLIDKDFADMMGSASALFAPDAPANDGNGIYNSGMNGDAFLSATASPSMSFGDANFLAYNNSSPFPHGAGPSFATASPSKKPPSIPRQLKGPYGTVPLGPTKDHFPKNRDISDDETIAALPEDVLNELLDLYFEYCAPILGHIVQESEFRKQNRADRDELLVCSMYALAARYAKNEKVVGTDAGTMYYAGYAFYAKARRIIIHTIDTPCLETISALVHLVTYASGSGRASASFLYAGMAIRMAQSLKLDLDPDFPEITQMFGPLSDYDKEYRRRLWWVCHTMDQYTSASADRSTFTNEKDAKVFPCLPPDVWLKLTWEDGTKQLKDKEPDSEKQVVARRSDWELTVLSSTGTVAESAKGPRDSTFEHHMTLAKIFGRVMQHVAQSKAQPALAAAGILLSSSESDARMHELETDLRDWLHGLPEWVRFPGRTFACNWTERNAEGALSPPPWEVAYLHIFYHTVVVMLHRPKMMGSLGSGPAMAMRSRHFLAAQQSATAVATMLEIVMSANPELCWITPFVSFCIFQTSLVHIVSAQTMRDSPEAVSAACQRIRTHLRALRGMSRYWLQGKRLSAMLEQLFASVEGKDGEEDGKATQESQEGSGGGGGKTPGTNGDVGKSRGTPPSPPQQQQQQQERQQSSSPDVVGGEHTPPATKV